MNDQQKKKVPRTALRFLGGACEFGAASEGAGEKIPVKLVARSARPIDHWYWGRIVHDLSGMQAAGPSIPLDYNHEPDEVIGYADKFDTSGDLVVSGALVPFEAGDRPNEIRHKAALGVPYQASIYFDPNDMVLEEIPQGRSVQVNGYSFEGPGVVVRQWTLRGVAICPYGADRNTSVQFAANDQIEVTFLRKENAMADQEKPVDNQESSQPAEPAKTEEKPVESKPAATPAETPAEPVETKQSAKTGKDFLAAFGQQGAAWYVEGKTWDEAQKLHADALAEENKTLKAKLAGVQFGQETPVSSEPAADDPASRANSALAARLGDSVARFAAGIKLPGKN